MRRIKCGQTNIGIQFKCDGRPLYAVLNRAGPGGGVYDLVITQNAGDPNMVWVSGWPEKLTAGVWTLALDTQCGCFMENVHFECPAPAAPSVHTPTSTTTGKIIECCPEQSEG